MTLYHVVIRHHFRFPRHHYLDLRNHHPYVDSRASAQYDDAAHGSVYEIINSGVYRRAYMRLMYACALCTHAHYVHVHIMYACTLCTLAHYI